jgi:chloride channel protein, CIC family
VLPEATPVDLRILGRTLLHAALVGLATGALGAVFFYGLELVQWLLLERLAGYQPLRASGEPGFASSHSTFRPWIMFFLPALGGLLAGLICYRFAPEAAGGGGDATIDAFHHQGGVIRRRVVFVKALASLFTLGSGGSGGREGPTMQIGGAIGSWVASALKVAARERHVLLVAGVAGGIAAVFRTPLGAALLAAEILYRDDFESDALVPAVLASVVSYSVVISVFGESTLLATTGRYPFVPAHLPWYGLCAVLVCFAATLFVWVMGAVRQVSQRLPVPLWLRPAIGGLALGLFAVPIIWIVGDHVGVPGQGLGLFGGGYGAAQMAVTGASWLPEGWTGVQILALLCFAKMLTSALTIATGGSAGDFAPSLAIGALIGGAFGRALELLTGDPRLDAGAFALVGMGTFYGGIAHVPLSALVLCCELAGSYDLLVPLMLSVGIAFVLLRRRALYHAQLPTRRDSPAHRETSALEQLATLRVDAVMVRRPEHHTFVPTTPAAEVMRRSSDAPQQGVFPVLNADDSLVGIITADALRVLAAEPDLRPVAIAADVMRPAITVRDSDHLRTAVETLMRVGLQEIPVVDETGKILGYLGETEIVRAYLGASGDTSRPRTGTFPIVKPQ